MAIVTEIAIDSILWAEHKVSINSELFNKIIEAVMSFHPAMKNQVKNFELSVLLTDNSKITSLNHEFRAKNAPTNVLSFPEHNFILYNQVDFSQMNNYIYLGDVAFAFEKIASEAKEKNIAFLNHFTHLALHSILHLIGYDHINDEDANLMERMEIKILQLFNIDSPY